MTKMHYQPRTLVSALLMMVFLFPLTLSAQESSPEATPSARAGDETIRNAQESAQSDLQKSILEDEFVTDEELAEALNAYIACMAESDYNMHMVTEPGNYGQWMWMSEPTRIDGTPPAFGQNASPQPIVDISWQCESTTILGVRAVYAEQAAMSSSGDIETNIIACMENTGAIEPGTMSVEDLSILHLAYEEGDQDARAMFTDTNVAICHSFPNYRGGPLISEPWDVQNPWESTPVATPTS